MKLDIKVFNAASTYVEFESNKPRKYYKCFENYDYKPTTDERVLMQYDEQAKMLITGSTYYIGNENFKSHIRVYNVIAKKDEFKYQIKDCNSEKEIWSADNVILTKKMFKDEIMKYLKSEYDRMNRLMQLLGLSTTNQTS